MSTNKLKNEKGQALFEMVIFLPFLIFLYTIFYTVGNSISGSINQQKAVRGYFYQLVKGNSYIVPAVDLNKLHSKSIRSVGFFSIGWAEKLEGGTSPFANCFKFSSMLKNGSGESCKDKKRDPPETSTFVRMFTMYGVCGPVFHDPGAPKLHKVFVIDQTAQLAPCSLE